MIPKPVHEIDPQRAAYVRALAPFLASIGELASQITRREAFRAVGSAVPIPTVGAVGRAAEGVGDVIRGAQATADILSRREVLSVARKLAPGVGGTIPPTVPASAAAGAFEGGLPRVPFTEAVADILARDPVLASNASEVAAAYNADHGFAVARAVEARTVERVQDAISSAIHTGAGVGDAVDSVRRIARLAGEDMADWTRSYAETVFRTNVATGYSAGRFRQMADPAVQVAIGGLRYTTAGDVDVRPNHQAADGLTAAPDDPVWQRITPPLGYNCRCGVDFVSWPELKRAGLVRGGKVRRASQPRGAHADAGFAHTGRPDILIYGAF